MALYFYKDRTVISLRKKRDGLRDLRREAIEQTNLFLSWALTEDRGLPDIPRRRVDEGGFDQLIAQRRGRVVCEQWWVQIIEQVESIRR